MALLADDKMLRVTCSSMGPEAFKKTKAGLPPYFQLR
ncbi:hypothetical protein GGE35_002060 [Rhizobium cellulosilyticum]|uniref:Uncharacterized protein n=1 Tax=Aliirhizobium cellulosilyticum TaxID=393664 RepID=A0A7W6Y3W1_9HYPH|nr:hypothetical protein [Rhizobium cellulosilyticum]